MRNLYTAVFLLLFAVVPIIRARSIVKRSDNDDNDSIEVERRSKQFYRHSISVHRFAKHVLCRRHDWRRYFYSALVEISCMDKRFVADLVVSLCTGKSDLLDKFVAQAFDANGDGYINEHEKNQFWY